HGNTSAFLKSRRHKFLLGGKFVGNPGGDAITYNVHFLGNDPLVEGLEDITVQSEQYYLLVDPAVKVVATTIMDGADMSWLAGVQMPVAWKRMWGQGRVFYCALGHCPEIFMEHQSLRSLVQRALHWSVRDSAELNFHPAQDDRRSRADEVVSAAEPPRLR
ncbi:MAG: ThuA domain-containing protein, partial [Terriglobales bacterium]